ncbi:MAG: hypothetical protein IJT37_10260 [Lachnospiraceae bacterium]|nr:hypothetical protein [Lachnospiraceae bacterium]
MIFFELFHQLDERMYRTVKQMDPLMNPCSRYLIDGNCLIILGANVSMRWNITNREITEEMPVKNFDLANETLYWFSEESAEGAMIRMISNAFRQWYNIDPFKSFAEFEISENDINRKLMEYGFQMAWAMDKMAVISNEGIVALESAITTAIEDDALRTAGISKDEWIYDARYFRRTDQLERAIDQYERVLRYSNFNERIFTEAAFCLGESSYFLGNYDNAVSMYYKCNLDYIDDENDFYIHIGHALLDVKMKHYEKELRTYYRGCLDRSYATEHMREVERAAAEVAAEFEEYEKTCLTIGKKKYNEHIAALPLKEDALNFVEMEEVPVEESRKTADNRYRDVKLVKPKILADYYTISLNETMSDALGFMSTGEYQKAYELYYKLAQSLDPESDYATWVNFQLGKLYCICNDAKNSYETLCRCRPGKFGVVYRQSDFFLLYTHVRIMCDDLESDERFRKLIRGRIDDYYAKFDSEYISLRSDQSIMGEFRKYEKECMNQARAEFSAYAFTENKSKGNRKKREEGRENRVLRGISRYINE